MSRGGRDWAFPLAILVMQKVQRWSHPVWIFKNARARGGRGGVELSERLDAERLDAAMKESFWLFGMTRWVSGIF